MRCASYCLADSLDFTKLGRELRRNHSCVTQYSDVISISSVGSFQAVFYYKQGCVVLWGFTKKQELALLEQLVPFLIRPLDEKQVDYFSVRLGSTTTIKPHRYFNVDAITVEIWEEELLLALSYGLAQSIKLAAAEESINAVVVKNSDLPLEMAKQGKIRLSRRSILKRLGEIFLKRSEVNLHQDYITVPAFFWSRSSLEPYYIQVEKFLDIPRRFSVLNQKLDVLSDTFNMLTTELQHQHSSILETIVILLIAIEIIFGFVLKFHS